MRKTPRPPISDHRLARLTAWLRLWLIWFVGLCAHAGTWGGRPRDLDPLARFVAELVIVSAGRRLDVEAFAVKRARHRQGRRVREGLRTQTGARLRRTLRGRDWRTRLMAILSVMRDLDTHVSALARRLRRGLTRLRVIDPKPTPAPALIFVPRDIACADSS